MKVISAILIYAVDLKCEVIDEAVVIEPLDSIWGVCLFVNLARYILGVSPFIGAKGTQLE